METIPLYTRDGQFVMNVLIPHFIIPAEAVLWGERCFVRRADGKYYEGLLYPVIEQRLEAESDKE